MSGRRQRSRDDCRSRLSVGIHSSGRFQSLVVIVAGSRKRRARRKHRRAIQRFSNSAHQQHALTRRSDGSHLRSALVLQLLVADLAAGQVANNLAALRTTLGFTSNLELRSWTMDHDNFPPVSGGLPRQGVQPLSGIVKQRIHSTGNTSLPSTALEQCQSGSASPDG